MLSASLAGVIGRLSWEFVYEYRVVCLSDFLGTGEASDNSMGTYSRSCMSQGPEKLWQGGIPGNRM